MNSALEGEVENEDVPRKVRSTWCFIEMTTATVQLGKQHVHSGSGTFKNPFSRVFSECGWI